jgi:hypothetical protein
MPCGLADPGRPISRHGAGHLQGVSLWPHNDLLITIHLASPWSWNSPSPLEADHENEKHQGIRMTRIARMTRMIPDLQKLEYTINLKSRFVLRVATVEHEGGLASKPHQFIYGNNIFQTMIENGTTFFICTISVILIPSRRGRWRAGWGSQLLWLLVRLLEIWRPVNEKAKTWHEMNFYIDFLCSLSSCFRFFLARRFNKRSSSFKHIFFYYAHLSNWRRSVLHTPP